MAHTSNMERGSRVSTPDGTGTVVRIVQSALADGWTMVHLDATGAWRVYPADAVRVITCDANMTTREECEFMRERLAAGLSDVIASCALHGAYGAGYTS
jgi:hypothetical protein